MTGLPKLFAITFSLSHSLAQGKCYRLLNYRELQCVAGEYISPAATSWDVSPINIPAETGAGARPGTAG
jgi:hypothetical protein